jgi:hypothetical protein
MKRITKTMNMNIVDGREMVLEKMTSLITIKTKATITNKRS